ncbi:ArfGap-domain-containing protein [Phlegmacium glaucopus]|nr:ArfGap-domain-containing protein [Phlegmacium glaucopus]
MSFQNKQRNQKIVLELASLQGNNICADCKARLPRWASYNLGIFICMNCASIHRKIGTHITKVKSLTVDDWTKEQVETMKCMGNVKSNAIYNPNEFRNPPPPNLEDSERDSEIEQYIRAKYEYKKFLDKSALVASKLGPSRSASLIAPRSAPSQSASFQSAPSQSASSHSALSHSAPSYSAPSYSAPFPQSSAHVTKPPSAIPTSSYTAPPKPPQVFPTAQPPQPSGGVWDDINSLKSNSQNSSLPLQYQQSAYPQGNPSIQLSAVSANSYPVGTASGTGLNPFQPNPTITRTNPFAPPPMTSPYPMTQQSFVSQSSPITPTYFPAAPPSQPFPSVPSQFPQSHSSIQQQYPQQMQPLSSPPFMYSNSAPAQPQIGGYNVSSGHSQFSGMTTMQMEQQAFQQQQQALHQQQQQQIQQQQQQQIQQQQHPQIQHQQHQQIQQQQHPQIQHQQYQQIQQQQHPQIQHQQYQQIEQQQHQQQQHQQLNQNYSSMQPQMVSDQINGVYGLYPQGGSFPSQTGGQWSAM